MKRKLVQIALFLPLLACLMGASTIDFDAGQPVPNPGGAPSTLEGKGPFAVDPMETLMSVNFNASLVGGMQSTTGLAATNQGKWSGSLLVAAGKYESFGALVTKDKAGTIVITFSKKVVVTVK